MIQPQVSIICLCFNHHNFLNEALESVLTQTYTRLQVIIVDDASTDGSQELIKRISENYPAVQILLLTQNVGNCKAFNLGLRLATGDFIIDFSTDDVMMPGRIEKQVEFFKTQEDRVGVVFTDATYIDANGEGFRNHYDHLLHKKLIDRIPTGDVFRDVLTRYFICSPSMMVRTKVMEDLGGYDETLSYEDFDFWVRASRKYHFAFLKDRLTKVRRIVNSMSSGWYVPGDKQLHSTFLVCEKAVNLCRDKDDRDALKWRVLYEFKQSVFSRNDVEAGLFAKLLRSLGEIPYSFYLIQVAAILPFPWAWLRRTYHQFVYG